MRRPTGWFFIFEFYDSLKVVLCSSKWQSDGGVKMTKHAKGKKNKKRWLKGPSALGAFPREKKQKWAEGLQEILNKDTLLEKDMFLLQYAQAICQFRLAMVLSEDTGPFWTEVNNLAEKGYSLGFTKEDFLTINLFFREKGRADLEQNYQFLKVKLESKTKD